MTATSDRIITLRLVRLLLTLFAVGTGIGLVASTAVPLRLPASVVDVAVAEPAVDTVAVPADPLEPETSCLSAPLRQRAAQTLVVGIPDATTIDAPVVADVLELGVGGVFINDGNVVSAEQITTLISGMRARSVVDLLVTTDEEAGRVSTFRQIVGATSSPRTLAAHSSSEDVRTFARELGGGLAALGLTSDLAPVADLDGGPAQGTIGDRAFSADPMVTADYAQAFAAGLSDAGLIPVAKHFPGLGGAGGDVHRRSATVTTPLEQMLSTDVLPFVALVDAGIPVVMLSHASYEALDPRRPASLSPAAYALLRDLGFTGVAMTDSLGMGAIHRRWDFPEAAVLAVRAGADAVLATDGRQAVAMVAAIVAAVEDGTLPEQRLDEAVARMLALKGIDPQTMTCAPPVAVPAMGDVETALRR